MKKLFAVFLVFCFCFFALLGCKEETIDEVMNHNNIVALTAAKTQPETTVPKVKMAAGGCAHSIALCEDGTVWGWGNDFYGCIDSGKPVQIAGLSDIIFVAAGNTASAAIKSDGTLWMWGAGWTSQGVMYPYLLTLDEPYMTDVQDVCIGNYFTVALKKDGTVWIWGEDTSNDMEAQKVPKKVEGLPEIKKVAASWYHVAFLDVDGNVWYIEQEARLPWVPQKLTEVSNATSIAGGGHHFVILKDDGTVCTFSADNYGFLEQLSDVAELSDVVDIAAGAFHSIAVKKDGTVWSWGDMENGLGDGVNRKSDTPVQVANITNATGVASGNWHALITTTDDLWSWGNNYMGQLGYGVKPVDPYDTSTNRNIPVKVNFGDETSDDSSSAAQSTPDTSSAVSKAISSATSSAAKPTYDRKPKDYPLPHYGFVSNSWEDLREHIKWDDLDVQNWGNPDPSEYLPLYAPFLKMDKDTLMHIIETARNLNWEDHEDSINYFERRALTITVFCENNVITYLQFGIYYDGRYYAYSETDKKIAFIYEELYQEIKGLFEAAPEWSEKYYARYGYYHYRRSHKILCKSE